MTAFGQPAAALDSTQTHCMRHCFLVFASLCLSVNFSERACGFFCPGCFRDHLERLTAASSVVIFFVITDGISVAFTPWWIHVVHLFPFVYKRDAAMHQHSSARGPGQISASWFSVLSLNWICGIEEASSEIPHTAIWVSRHHDALAPTIIPFPFALDCRLYAS
jgi:hypothetical protein